MDRIEELKIKLNNEKKELEVIRNNNNISEEEKESKLKEYIKNNKEIFRELINLQKLKNNQILNIIEKIKEKYNEKTGGDAKVTFTEGGCYYLPIMLKKLMPEENVKIYISTVGEESHALSKIDNNYYDITGNVLNYNLKKSSFLDNKEINISNYKEANEDDYNYFVDICHLGKNKEYIKNFELICDEITNELLEEFYEENVKNSKIA